jgi:hypothetical protein
MRPTPTARLIVIGLLTIACAHQATTTEITRDRAIALARAQVKFEPFDIKADRTRTNGRAVWRVELKGRLPGQPPLLFETAVVEIDAVSGGVVSIAKT